MLISASKHTVDGSSDDPALLVDRGLWLRLSDVRPRGRVRRARGGRRPAPRLRRSRAQRGSQRLTCIASFSETTEIDVEDVKLRFHHP